VASLHSVVCMTLLVVWFIHEQCCLVLDHVICCPVMQLNYGHQISEVQRLQRFVLLLEVFGSSKKKFSKSSIWLYIHYIYILKKIKHLGTNEVFGRSNRSTLVLLLLHPKGYSTARHRSRTIEAEQAHNCQAPQAVDLIWSGGSNRNTLTTVFNSTMTRRGHDSIIETFNEQ
jgi:hypothetical protein